MMQLETAEGRTVVELTRMFNRGFEQYVVPLSLTEAQVEMWIQVDGIERSECVVVRKGDADAALAMVARKGDFRRIASMGVAPPWRRQGICTAIVEHLKQGGGTLELEVISTNTPAIAVYEKAGFTVVDQLSGHIISNPEGCAAELTKISLDEAAARLVRDGDPDPTWLLSTANMGALSAPAMAVALGPATLVLADPSAEEVRIRGLSVPPDARRQGHGHRILRAAWARWPNRRWMVVPKIISAWAGFFDAAGFERHPVQQHRMRWHGP
ncbi:MAG: GNAT family N-acetyltransferase [Bradymonadia bacterium]